MEDEVPRVYSSPRCSHLRPIETVRGVVHKKQPAFPHTNLTLVAPGQLVERCKSVSVKLSPEPPSQTPDENLIMVCKRQLKTSGQSDLRFEWFGSLGDTSPESRYIWTDIIELALLCMVLHQTSSICVFNYGSDAPTADIPGGIHWKRTHAHGLNSTTNQEACVIVQ